MTAARALLARPVPTVSRAVAPVLLGAGALLAIGHLPLADDPTWDKPTYLGAMGCAAVAAWVAVARRPAGTRTAWCLVALAISASAGGDLTEALVETTTGSTPDISVADGLWVVSYVAFFVGLWSMGRSPRQGTARDTDALLDTLVAGVVTLFVVWEIALQDLLADTAVSPPVRLVWAVYPLFDVALVTLTTRLLLDRRGRRPFALTLLLVGAAVWFATDLVYLVGDSPAVGAGADLGWTASLLLFAGAATVAGRDQTPIADDQRPPATLGRIALILAPVFLPALMAVRGAVLDQPAHPLALVLASAALLTLATVRAHRMLGAAEVVRRQVQAQKDRFRALAAHSADASVVLDPHGCVVEVFGGLVDVLGVDPDDLVGTEIATHPLLVDQDLFAELVVAARSPGATIEAEVRVVQADGALGWLALRIVNLLDDPAVEGIVINVHDVTDRKRAEDEMAHRAFHDPLTGLANRALLGERIEAALGTSDVVALAYVDIDDFKRVNDRFGHGVGDHLLQSVAGRIVDTVPRDVVVARIGGDEFAVLWGGADETEVLERCAAVLDAVAAPLDLDGQVESVTASIGLAHAGPDSSASSLLHDADVAMYRAKVSGKARILVHDAALADAAVTQVRLAIDVAHALARDQLAVVYQPVVRLADGVVVGFESLLRWTHPQLGPIPPSRFIPLAEQGGAIIPIGSWVLRTVCATAAGWRTRPDAAHLSIGVNVSARQLESDQIVHDVEAALAASGLSADALVLELTESALVHDPTGTARRLDELRALGVRIAIDDFGTGYSSLSRLRQFPIDILKIDQSFVEAIDGSTAPPIVRGLIDLGGTLGQEIVAEGIEREDQLAWLRAVGCALGQGYLFSHPLPADDALGTLRFSAHEVLNH